MNKIFRFDDVCGNADLHHINNIATLFRDTFENSEILYCVSPLFFSMKSKDPVQRQRVFPRILNAYSNHTNYFKTDRCCALRQRDFPEYVTVVSHGLVHVDHRLMCYEAQELSIVISSALTGAKIFVPPFNKWNKDTEDVCRIHRIELIKFEDGWKCIEYEPYDSTQNKWYLHARELKVERVKKWIGN